MPNCTILIGDVMARLKQMRTESVHCIVTSPPYFGLRAYGTEPQTWGGDAECLHLFGPSGRKGGGSHTHTASSQQNGRGHMDQHEGISKASTGQFCSRCQAWRGELGLEPSPEMYLDHIVMIFEELRRVLRKDGSLWLNCGDSYAGSWGAQSREHASKHAPNVSALSANQVKAAHRRSHTGSIRSPGLKPKDLMMMPARMALALQAAGWWVRSDNIWEKPSPMPESVSDRTTVSHEHVFMLTKSSRYFYDDFAVRESSVSDHPSGNGFVRPESLSRQNADGTPRGNVNQWNDVGGSRNLRSVWTIPAEPHSDCLCNVCGRYYENPRGLKREKLDVDAPARGPRDVGRDEIGLRDSTKFGRGAGWREKQKPVGGWAAGDRAHTELEGNYTEERLGKIICECGASDWTQHFAAYPTKLVDICVRAGTSERGVCPQCLAPWIRIVKTEREFRSGSGKSGVLPIGKNGPHFQGGGQTLDIRRGPTPLKETIAWKPSCKCIREEYPDEPLTGREWEFIIERTVNKFMPIAATVLDPFGGMGTTAIAALRLGRDAILIELQPQYARMAEIRVERDAPLFNHVTVDRPEEPIADIETALA